MIMKTKHVQNIGQIVRRGKIGKLPGGGKEGKQEKLPGAQQIAQGDGAMPLLPHSYSPSLNLLVILI